ncbi:helix-turn-helix domain-containing protein [Streptomyces sp. P9-2B-2]|uniref:PucR family transcriptional regulator n=1 Tax=Streptomyces TaxID=1883 RepID=UPI002256DE9C|nr:MULTISPECIES: PucR family transcriptional regulator [Streptomyces]MCX4635318.1 helix-turn-helix domain-containing protein [Streptomyces platensis]WJY41724.1 helix-turn-helix domain-containing protein [Streptomyces sp. P9-2B-2]
METSTTVPESAAALHAGIDALTDEVIDGLRSQLPSYAAVSPDRLRPRVLASLRNGLSLVERWAEERRSARGAGRGDGPAYGIAETHLDEVTSLARSLPVEDVISAYRIGTDIVWRRFSEEMTARGGTAEDLLPIAETLRAWVDANTLRIVRSCRVGLQGDDPTAEGRLAAMVRALLLGEARWDKSLGAWGAGDGPADGYRPEGHAEDAEAVDGSYEHSALRLPFRARLPDVSPPGEPDGAPAAAGHAGPGDRAFHRTVALLRPWLALDEAGRPLVTTVDGEVAGLLVGRPAGLCRSLILGLGAPAPASGVATEFTRATQALRAAAGFGLVGAYTREELGLRAAVVALPAVGEQLVRLRLAPLDERGEDGVQLAEAAAAYLRQGLRLDAAARTLYVHPNTLRNRLRRFEEITGTNLRDPADLAEVWWALTHRRFHAPPD